MAVVGLLVGGGVRRGGRLQAGRRWSAGWLAEEKDSSEAYGRKLHAVLGRFATSVKISDMSLCWTLVSWCDYQYALPSL